MGDQNDAKFLLVAAIDFGTTYSGYGFSFTDHPDEIKMAKNWGAEVGHQSYKTPTSLLVDKNGHFKAFGYAAEQQYGDAVNPEADDNEVVESGDEEEETVSELHLFKHFKMDLHGKEKLDKSVEVKATDGYPLEAVKVFGMALGFLKDHLVEAVSNALQSKLDVSQVRWVLTVPAIWSEVAKNFMKEAAVKGELVSKVSSPNLIIALEPEAASLFCRTKDLSHFVDDDKVKKEKLAKDDKYMVVDAGGGTMDITVHEVQADDKVKELHRASGGPWGGIYVDKQLAALYDAVFGNDVMAKFRESHPNQWMTILIDWEVKKKGTTPTDRKPVNLTINANFADFYREKTGKSIKEIIKENADLGVKFAAGFIRISADKIAEMFDNVIKPTMDHLKDLLKKPKVKDVKCIFIVGGFGESKFLQHRIKSEFGSGRTVLVPLDAGLCVIKGAVLFGHSPHAITSRIARRTFCFRTTKPKDTKGIKYNPSQITEDGSRIRYLRTLVKKNDEVEEGDVKTITTRPVNNTQNSVKFKIYTADSEEVNDPDADDVYELGELVINVDPVKGKGKTDNEIELKMQFGGTSVKVTAKHKATGKTEVADFTRPDA